MKKKLLFCLILLLSLIPFLFCLLTYQKGVTLTPWLFPIQIMLSIASFLVSDRLWKHLLCHGVMLIATASGLWVSTLLFYNRISSDSETLMVGNAEVFIGIITVLLVMLISSLIFKKRKHPSEK